MKRFSITVLLFSLLISTLNAESMKCGAGKCGGAMKSQRSSGLIHQTKEVDGYNLIGVRGSVPYTWTIYANSFRIADNLIKFNW